MTSEPFVTRLGLFCKHFTAFCDETFRSRKKEGGMIASAGHANPAWEPIQRPGLQTRLLASMVSKATGKAVDTRLLVRLLREGAGMQTG